MVYIDDEKLALVVALCKAPSFGLVLWQFMVVIIGGFCQVMTSGS